MLQTEKHLSGIKVVELATFIAAPSCARILGEWGAEVVKIESLNGDIYRRTGNAISDDENPLFAIENEGKKFISVDIKTSDGVKIVDQLLEKSDIFVTNLRVDALKKLGLSYEDLSEKYPELIYTHVLGYGDKGPLKDKPGYDSTAFFARSGILADTTQAGETPTNYANGLGDHTLGMYILSGVLAALYKRTKTGRGELVTSGLYQAAIYSLSSMLMATQLNVEYPADRKNPGNPLNNIYQCKDGEWLMLAGTDYYSSLSKFAEITDLPILVENDEYNSPLGGYICSKEITAIIENRISQKNRSEWDEIFKKGDFACEILQHLSDVLEDEQAWANDYLLKVTYPTGNSGIVPNLPVSFGNQQKSEFKHPPKVGGDSVAILKSLGYTDGKIDELLSNRIVVG